MLVFFRILILVVFSTYYVCAQWEQFENIEQLQKDFKIYDREDGFINANRFVISNDSKYAYAIISDSIFKLNLSNGMIEDKIASFKVESISENAKAFITEEKLGNWKAYKMDTPNDLIAELSKDAFTGSFKKYFFVDTNFRLVSKFGFYNISGSNKEMGNFSIIKFSRFNNVFYERFEYSKSYSYRYDATYKDEVSGVFYSQDTSIILEEYEESGWASHSSSGSTKSGKDLSITDAAISMDGKNLVCVSNSQYYFYPKENIDLKIVSKINPILTQTKNLTISTNNKFLLSTRNNKIYYFRLKNNEFVDSITIPESIEISKIYFAPDNSYLYITDTNGELYRIDVSPLLDVENNHQSNELENLTISPNPVYDYFYINEPNVNTIEIYSIEGIKIFEESNTSRINASKLSPGMYFVKSKNRIAKFIKY